MYDTFIDEKKGKEVQLKNFHCGLLEFKVGDEVPMKEFGYPEDGNFWCFVQPDMVVLIEKSKFIGIFSIEDKIIQENNHRIWRCDGYEETGSYAR